MPTDRSNFVDPYAEIRVWEDMGLAEQAMMSGIGQAFSTTIKAAVAINPITGFTYGTTPPEQLREARERYLRDEIDIDECERLIGQAVAKGA